MPQADEDERQHQEDLRKSYTKRKRLLEIRKARQGDNVDPAVDIELGDIADRLAEIDATLAAYEMAAVPKPTPEAVARIRDRYDDEFDFLIAQLGSITGRQTQTEERTARIEERQVKADEKAQDIAASLAQWVTLSEEWREITGEHLTAIRDEVQSLAHGQGKERWERQRGQRRNFWLSIATIVLVLFVAGLLLYVFR